MNVHAQIQGQMLIGGEMVKRRSGAIINNASISGMVVNKGIHGRTYETAKAALMQPAKVSLVVDDLVSLQPFIARALRVYGDAEPAIERVGMVGPGVGQGACRRGRGCSRPGRRARKVRRRGSPPGG